MRRKDTHSLLIDLTIFVIVCSFFVYSAKRSFYPPNPPTPPEPRLNPLEAERNPASVAPREQTSLPVGCLPSNTKILHTQLAYLRIEGELCESKKVRVLDGRAKNETNGAEISAFVDRPNHKVATAYFPLQPGPNRILLEFTLASGKKQLTELTIERD